MSIEIFEREVTDTSTSTSIVSNTWLGLFHDAGFSDVSSIGDYGNFVSNSGVYGVKNISLFASSIPSTLTKYYLVKDDSQKCLMVYGNTVPSDTAEGEFYFYNTIIVNGKSTTVSGVPRFSDNNVLKGNILPAVDTSEAKLAPFLKWTGDTFEPFYVAVNLVNYQANTKVTDGTNSFTSLGNLFYIKNA